VKRLHVHVAVGNIAQSTRFYSTLFGAEPTVVKPDYAKWMLDDPRVNFAISTRGRANTGLDHLGIQVEDQAELAEVYGRLKKAEAPVLEQGEDTEPMARQAAVSSCCAPSAAEITAPAAKTSCCGAAVDHGYGS
jgi:catechol 2,3-dioxygenase-like lactoylglutathione lyase family enzyme